MGWARLCNGVKYIYLVNDNDFKKKSLCYNVYFTLRDIFANAESVDHLIAANYFIRILTSDIYFEERTETIQCKNMLYQKDYVERLQIWLKSFNVYCFEFHEPEEDEQIDMKEYMIFDDWWDQFHELRDLIDEQYEKCCKFINK